MSEALEERPGQKHDVFFVEVARMCIVRLALAQEMEDGVALLTKLMSSGSCRNIPVFCVATGRGRCYHKFSCEVM